MKCCPFFIDISNMIIQIECEIIRGMAGEVRYCTKPCPHKVIGVGNIPAMVGSTECKMCQHHGGITEASDCVICNHE